MMTKSVADEEATAGLVNMIVVLADNKYALGRRLAEWAVGPPTLEASVAGAAIGQQLLGQARVLYPVLEQLDASGRILGAPDQDSGRTRRYAMTAVDEPWETWPHAVCSLFLVNNACNVVLEAMRESRRADLSKRVGRMLEDDRLQAQYGAGRVRELVARYSAGRVLLQQRIDETFGEVLMWFGPPGERGVTVLNAAELVTGDNEDWRQRWLDRVGPVLTEVGVTVPAHQDESGRWEWEEMPWDRWNPLRRRLETTSA